MESLFSLPLPFQRRLTKMYTDTKSSYDFVKEPVQKAEDPELILLHRKLRIQKDRLVSWGLEWSDPSQSPDIDESINKAGLTELVGSVMSTIKEILAEAEPLWQSSKRLPDERPGSEKSVDRKVPLIMWDRTRFEDLVRDLTMSIDTLYDLSRTRQSARRTALTKVEISSSSSQPKSPQLEERAFQSTRMQTPQQIDPATLIWARDLKGINSNMLQPAKSPRQIVFMRRQASFPNFNSSSRKSSVQSQTAVPVLLEHAPYDAIYSITGISPSMTRFEKLFAAISHANTSSERFPSGLLRLLGYFEEPDHARFCLLFELPKNFGPVDIDVPRMPAITILSDLLYSDTYEPSLEVKYRLAHNVATAVFDLHAKGVVHGNVKASNILFLEPQVQSRLDLSNVNMRQSFLTSFDLFSDNATDSSEPTVPCLHRHPLDPRYTRYTRLTSESKSLDLYSLAMLLLQIGLWSTLPDIFPNASVIPEHPISVFKKLASRCGSLYLRAVEYCWNAPEDELSQRTRPDVKYQKVCCKVSKALDACCAIDEVSDSEESDDSLPGSASPIIPSGPASPLERKLAHDPLTLRRLTSSVALTSPTIDWSQKSSPSRPVTSFPEKIDWTEKSSSKSSPKPSAPFPQVRTELEKPKSKLRTYPSVRINQEHLNYWHTGLIPLINHALRGFYKKYPESVEISLESVGESPTTTKPTILVICTSVNKVRSILKKSLVYDKSIYGLKVCRGKVVRSRKQGARRSMAKEGGVREAQNISHQLRPSNGASIGAYVNERHLPPVSFGGMIEVDGKPYGMTVHHMLDDPSEGEESDVEEPQEPILRSSGPNLDMPDLTYSESSAYSSDEEFMYELSDYESDFSADEEEEEDPFSDADASDEDSDDELEAGDIRGISQGCGEGYTITQPAIDDIDEEFYPDPETRNEDHTDTFSLGEVYASSGIRRRIEDGTIHEIDWALFEFSPSRHPTSNRISSSSRFCASPSYPLTVAPSSSLSNLEVHCMARTSGLQSGRILESMVIVKIFGRRTPSASWQVAGKLGVPGDSGAWVVENEGGRACGHVLAWSERKRVAYICPMDVLLRDIGETLKADSVSFPGGEEVYARSEGGRGRGRGKGKIEVLGEGDIEEMMRGLEVADGPVELEGMENQRGRDLVGGVLGEGHNEAYIPMRVITKEDDRENSKMKMGKMPEFVLREKMVQGEGEGTEVC